MVEQFVETMRASSSMMEGSWGRYDGDILESIALESSYCLVEENWSFNWKLPRGGLLYRTSKALYTVRGAGNRTPHPRKCPSTPTPTFTTIY